VNTATTKLNNLIPVMGSGRWELSWKSCMESVCNAIQIGYRHIDTEQMYQKEEHAGKGIKQSGINRKNVFDFEPSEKDIQDILNKKS
jgi:diketogulonate reductase-like aldo/keto reductase